MTIQPPILTVTPPRPDCDDWVGSLETNAHGLKLLTLRRAFELAAAGCCAGWYISPFALAWTVGRMAADGRRFHVISEGEPLRFESVGEAFEFLGGILRLAAAPQVSIAPFQVSFGPGVQAPRHGAY